MRYDKYREKVSEDTGPIDTETIKRLTSEQNKQRVLNKEQKRRHDNLINDVKDNPLSLPRLKSSFGYAIEGIKYVFDSQPNLKIHCIFAVLAIALSVLLRISTMEWLVIILTIALVIVLEFFNTAIEELVDLYTQDYSYLAKVAKDVSAATVLIMAIFAVIIGMIIFLPKIINLLWILKSQVL